jgi:copper chaperone CopZ
MGIHGRGTNDLDEETAMRGDRTTSTYAVSGMTCGHCVAAVTDELGRLDGVSDVAVELVPGGLSKVTVTSAGPLDEAQVREAVDEAGYDVAGSTA